jgi:hypothetical protein
MPKAGADCPSSGVKSGKKEQIAIAQQLVAGEGTPVNFGTAQIVDQVGGSRIVLPGVRRFPK